MVYNFEVSMKWNRMVIAEAWAAIEHNKQIEETVNRVYNEYLENKKKWVIRDKEREEYYARLIYERDFLPLELSDYVFYFDPKRPELKFEQDDDFGV